MMLHTKLKSLVIALCSLWILSGCASSYMFHGATIDPLEPAPDFTLTDHTGQTFRLSDQQGQVVVLFFGFTTCPDICPTTLADLAAARQRLGSQADRLRVVMVTVDPERDTEDVLRRYMPQFDPSFIGVRGTPDALASIYKSYGVTHITPEEQQAHGNHTSTNPVHSEYRYVIDTAGRWRIMHSMSESIDETVSDLQYLLRERR